MHDATEPLLDGSAGVPAHLNVDIESSVAQLPKEHARTTMQRRIQRILAHRPVLHESVAEALGTYVMIMFGIGSVAAATFSEQIPSMQGSGANLHSSYDRACNILVSTSGSYLAINVGWALGVFFGIMVAGGVSGAHLNPAVTLALVAHGQCAGNRFIPFAAAQVLGAFLGAATVYAVYIDALRFHLDACSSPPGHKDLDSASVFTTFPQHFEGVGAGVVDQVVGTALLMLGIFAIADDRQRGDDSSDATGNRLGNAAAVAVLVLAIGISFGFNTGYAINPARDLGPRIFVSMAGWGAHVFAAAPGQSVAWWWCGPIAGTLLGGLVGSTLYAVLIGWQWPRAGATRALQNTA